MVTSNDVPTSPVTINLSGSRTYPSLKMYILGNYTVIDTFKEINDFFGVENKEFEKFLKTKSGARLVISGKKALIETKIDPDRMRKIYQEFLKSRQCTACASVDIKVNGKTKKCEACGHIF